MSARFSLQRLRALVTKEFIQILRDRSTFGMIFMMPIIQLLLYGYAINTNPKMLPTALVACRSIGLCARYHVGAAKYRLFQNHCAARDRGRSRRPDG